MTIQNYPVFENGQVLTSASLNDIIDYLEPQDRLTRTRMIGIGVLCGLEVSVSANSLSITKGVAVTSTGLLIAEDAVQLTKMRPYKLPQPDVNTATDAEKAEAKYPFLFDGNDQRLAFELLPPGFVPARGETDPSPITPAALADRTVMLFLERSRDALRNCDVNDCADKGSEMSFTLRRLLVSRADADKMLAEEARIAGRNVDRATHPRRQLSPLPAERLNPAGSGAVSYPTLTARQVKLAVRQIGAILDLGRAAFRAYQPLLAPLWPDSDFPDGPLPAHHALPLLGHWANQPLLAQYLYAATQDLTTALNEFLAAAARHDAECCPDPARFPSHVLLGDAVTPPTASQKAPRSMAELAVFDASALGDGPGTADAPAQRRHHFVPSPLFNGCAAEVQSLFHRFVLMAQCFDLRGLVPASLRITPSRNTDAPLGDRAIPAWLGLRRGSDLQRNWSWSRARSGLLGSVTGYALIPDKPDEHPARYNLVPVDFYRIEGHVGRPLGSVLAEIAEQKRALGLSFAVEPVFLGAGSIEDGPSRAAAAAVMRRLLLCQMRELDVMFLTLMSGLFSLMVFLIKTLGAADATKATRKTAPTPTPTPAPSVGDGRNIIAGLRLTPITLDLRAERELATITRDQLNSIRAEMAFSTTLVQDLARGSAATLEPRAIAEIYNRTRDASAGGELIDRVKIALRDVDATIDHGTVYPAIALMARAEALIAATSARSLADFDQPRFTTALRGLADAYEGYADLAETDPAKAGAATAAANQAIIDNRGVIAAAAAQFGNQSITAELEKQLMVQFGKQCLDQYAARHPGLDHKGGVAEGGTFVLLYLHRSAVEAAVAGAIRLATDDFATAFKNLVRADAPNPSLDAALEALKRAHVPASADGLEEFVVVGDLCRAGMCCDGECAETEALSRIRGLRPIPAPRVFDPGPVLAPTVPASPIPTTPVVIDTSTGTTTAPTPVVPVGPAVVIGTVTHGTPILDVGTILVRDQPLTPIRGIGTVAGGLDASFGRSLAGRLEVTVTRKTGRREVPAGGAELTITDADRRATSVTVGADGTLGQPIAAGKYSLVARIGDKQSEPARIIVETGITASVSLVIPA